MLPRILILALCCTLLSCKNLVEKYKRSSSGVSELDKKVLYDFREPIPQRTVDVRQVPEAMLVLNSCNPPVQKADGSFTYAAEQETAFLERCGASSKMFIFSGSKLQASSDTPYSTFAATFDLNKDDKNEFLLVGDTTHDGVVTREASLENIEKNSLRTVESFGIVYSDPCVLFTGATEAKKQEMIAKGISPNIEAVRILYLPRPNHEMPSFTAERYRASCPTDPGTSHGNWQAVSGK